ncbi:MAG: tetratricopeptide repeat protein [Acidobacteria bacterium]|nr:tetratricopeptide repeat protein [Acidobacteriota bacterium]
MRAGERQHLKRNEFVMTVARVTEFVATHRDRVILGAIAVGFVVVASVGYSWWRGNVAGKGGALLGAAMTTYEAPIVPAPTVPGATQQAGTYPSKVARDEAALTAFEQVIDAYPSTDAAIAARYHRAAALMALARYEEAEQGFQATVDTASGTVFEPMAKLGQAEVLIASGSFDKGLQLLENLSADRDGLLPVDGVLMQLARAYKKAGKPAEARTAYKRVVDEFPNSLYVPEARQELVTLG